jgi:hypothetical protein
MKFLRPGYFSPSPDKVHINEVGFHPNQLTFQWNSVAPECSTVHYNILASNCGSCPTTTHHTNVTCTDVPINGGICTFAVSIVVCENDMINQTGIITLSHTMRPKKGIIIILEC